MKLQNETDYSTDLKPLGITGSTLVTNDRHTMHVLEILTESIRAEINLDGTSRNGKSGGSYPHLLLHLYSHTTSMEQVGVDGAGCLCKYQEASTAATCCYCALQSPPSGTIVFCIASHMKEDWFINMKIFLLQCEAPMQLE